MNEGTEAAEKLALALAGSLILHFALIFGLQIRPQISPHLSPAAFQARLVHTILDSPQPAPDPQAMKPKAAELPLPEPKAATEPAARQKPAMPSAMPTTEISRLPSVDAPLIEDPTYYTAREVDVHPSALQAIQPDYPDAAASADVAGSVVLLLLLDESGKVKEVTVEEASPPDYFEKSAVEAFRNARFMPAQRQGRVVKSRIRIKVVYELKDRKPTIDKTK